MQCNVFLKYKQFSFSNITYTKDTKYTKFYFTMCLESVMNQKQKKRNKLNKFLYAKS